MAKQSSGPGTQAQAEKLWAAYGRDRTPANRNRLVVHYLPLVKLNAEKLKGTVVKSVEVNELKQAGSLGLIEAVERFDAGRGVKFNSYAPLVIRGRILDYLRNLDWVPRQVRKRTRAVDRLRSRVMAAEGRPLDLRTACAMMDLTWRDYCSWLTGIGDGVVAQVHYDHGDAGEDEDADTGRMDAMADTLPNAADVCAQNALLERVWAIVERTLTPRQRAIVELYYRQDMTMKEIGRMMDLSESRICQICASAVDVLRSRLNLDGVFEKRTWQHRKIPDDAIREAYAAASCDREAGGLVGLSVQGFRARRHKLNLPAKGRRGGSHARAGTKKQTHDKEV